MPRVIEGEGFETEEMETPEVIVEDVILDWDSDLERDAREYLVGFMNEHALDIGFGLQNGLAKAELIYRHGLIIPGKINSRVGVKYVFDRTIPEKVGRDLCTQLLGDYFLQTDMVHDEMLSDLDLLSQTIPEVRTLVQSFRGIQSKLHRYVLALGLRGESRALAVNALKSRSTSIRAVDVSNKDPSEAIAYINDVCVPRASEMLAVAKTQGITDLKHTFDEIRELRQKYQEEWF